MSLSPPPLLPTTTVEAAAAAAPVWTLDQLERKRLVEAGHTVVANKSRPTRAGGSVRDAALLAWGEAHGLLVPIGRPSCWGNPFKMDCPKSRTAVIADYKVWLAKQPLLQKKLASLAGKILVCHCFPLPCHGDVLVAALEHHRANQ